MKIDMMKHRAWMRLPSGRHLDLVNPDSNAWLHSDLATRLSRTARWGGESKWPMTLSVAQHSLMVLELVTAWSETPLTPAEALRELLHDAEEGFLGFDAISPLKPVLGEAFRQLCARLIAAIETRYELPAWSDEAHALHKRADHAAAASEAFHCVGWSREEISEVLGIEAPVLAVDVLSSVYGDTPWEPWAPEVAARRYLERLEALLAAREAELCEAVDG